MHSEHFTESELQCKCGCGQNGCTEPLLHALEAFRAAVARPVTIRSAFRCAKHNAAVGGVPNSEHTRGEAADVAVPGLSPAAMEAEATKLATLGVIGGVGRDDHHGYIHIDVRKNPARWCYEQSGQQCRWYPPANCEPSVHNA
jgi:hypothetical protein